MRRMVLLLDVERVSRDLLVAACRTEGLEVLTGTDVAGVQSLLRRALVDAVVVRHAPPALEAWEVLAAVRREAKPVPVIFVGAGRLDEGVAAMRGGAAE